MHMDDIEKHKWLVNNNESIAYARAEQRPKRTFFFCPTVRILNMLPLFGK